MKNSNSKMVKKFITNNGLEFCLKMLSNFCKKNDIARHQRVVRTSHNNGLNKRFNKTVI